MGNQSSQEENVDPPSKTVEKRKNRKSLNGKPNHSNSSHASTPTTLTNVSPTSSPQLRRSKRKKKPEPDRIIVVESDVEPAFDLKVTSVHAVSSDAESTKSIDSGILKKSPNKTKKLSNVANLKKNPQKKSQPIVKSPTSSSEKDTTNSDNASEAQSSDSNESEDVPPLTRTPAQSKHKKRKNKKLQESLQSSVISTVNPVKVKPEPVSGKRKRRDSDEFDLAEPVTVTSTPQMSKRKRKEMLHSELNNGAPENQSKEKETSNTVEYEIREAIEIVKRRKLNNQPSTPSETIKVQPVMRLKFQVQINSLHSEYDGTNGDVQMNIHKVLVPVADENDTILSISKTACNMVRKLLSTNAGLDLDEETTGEDIQSIKHDEFEVLGDLLIKEILRNDDILYIVVGKKEAKNVVGDRLKFEQTPSKSLSSLSKSKPNNTSRITVPETPQSSRTDGPTSNRLFSQSSRGSSPDLVELSNRRPIRKNLLPLELPSFNIEEKEKLNGNSVRISPSANSQHGSDEETSDRGNDDVQVGTTIFESPKDENEETDDQKSDNEDVVRRGSDEDDDQKNVDEDDERKESDKEGDRNNDNEGDAEEDEEDIAERDSIRLTASKFETDTEAEELEHANLLTQTTQSESLLIPTGTSNNTNNISNLNGTSHSQSEIESDNEENARDILTQSKYLVAETLVVQDSQASLIESACDVFVPETLPMPSPLSSISSFDIDSKSDLLPSARIIPKQEPKKRISYPLLSDLIAIGNENGRESRSQTSVKQSQRAGVKRPSEPGLQGALAAISALESNKFTSASSSLLFQNRRPSQDNPVESESSESEDNSSGSDSDDEDDGENQNVPQKNQMAGTTKKRVSTLSLLVKDGKNITKKQTKKISLSQPLMHQTHENLSQKSNSKPRIAFSQNATPIEVPSIPIPFRSGAYTDDEESSEE